MSKRDGARRHPRWSIFRSNGIVSSSSEIAPAFVDVKRDHFVDSLPIQTAGSFHTKTTTPNDLGQTDCIHLPDGV
jgi:hypothetical protein